MTHPKRGLARYISVRGFQNRYQALDGYQRRHRWLGFPLAVRQKYADDQGGYLAATITYYAFFSVFPLLLVFVSVLGFALRGHAKLQHSIVRSALGQFPVVGHDLQIHSLRGSSLGLAVGLAGAIWAGTGVFLAAGNAMDQLWGVPIRKRPSFLRARGRAFLLLLALGAGVLCSSGLGGLSAVGAGYGAGWKVGSLALAAALNFLVFWVAFKLLTVHDVSWRSLRPGAVAAAIGYTALQLVGGYYVGHVLHGAGNTYGTFALVIGLLSWIYLAVHIALLAAEANVVAAQDLSPRSLSLLREQPLSSADERALTARAVVEERRSDETISADFGRTST